MQCSVLERNLNGWNIVKMVNNNNVKNTCKKDYNLDHIVDQQCTRFQEVAEPDGVLQVGMPTCSVDQTEAVRRYYAAFPALKKGQESPLQYYLPPPAWCRKSDTDLKSNMQSELSIISKEWNSKNKKFSTGKERRNSYHGQRKNGKKRFNSYSRSFESKESLPEWVTHEGAWDMETQDPVKEFIRALALDEGYGTCENTVADDAAARVPDLADLDLDLALPPAWPAPAPPPAQDDLYAQFEAKFDRSIEALWDDRDTPDDDYQELPIDFQDLLSSPSDKFFAVSDGGQGGLAWLADKAWPDAAGGRAGSAARLADALHARLQPLNIAEPEQPPPLDPFALYAADDICDAAEAVASAMRSLAAINHSRDRSGFCEVPPRRRAAPRAAPAPRAAAASPPREDLLTSARTHFRPIRREPEPGAAPYRDGDTFDIRGELDAVAFHRSASGSLYLEGSLERYLEYRGDKGIDYGRLRLTAAQRCPDLDDPAFRLRFPLRQRDAAAQTEPAARPCEGCGRAAKKKRPSAMDSIWSGGGACPACAWPAAAPPPGDAAAEWPGLPADGDAAAGDRKRRHSAALRCAAGAARCSHPHARFLACCALQDRPLTR